MEIVLSKTKSGSAVSRAAHPAAQRPILRRSEIQRQHLGVSGKR